MGRRDIVLEDLRQAAASLGRCTLALRASRIPEAQVHVRRAIERINVCTSELSERLDRKQPEAD